MLRPVCSPAGSSWAWCAGKGYFRPYLRMFDPGWKGPQAKHGAQDTDTEDWGNDPGGVINRCAPQKLDLEFGRL